MSILSEALRLGPRPVRFSLMCGQLHVWLAGSAGQLNLEAGGSTSDIYGLMEQVSTDCLYCNTTLPLSLDKLDNER
jgi:hypothetical protein